MESVHDNPPRARNRLARRRPLPALLSGCALVPVLTVAQPAAASGWSSDHPGHSGRHVVRALKPLSGPTPFPHGCGGPQDGTHIPGAEIEPAVTVSPRHPRTIVATWQQDLGVGGRSDPIGPSPHRGRTGSRHTIPGVTRGTGGAAGPATH